MEEEKMKNRDSERKKMSDSLHKAAFFFSFLLLSDLLLFKVFQI